MSDKSVPELDRCLRTALSDGLCTGAVCIAAVGNRVFHTGAYGFEGDDGRPKKVEPSTLFDLSDLTMPLAGSVGAMVLTSTSRLDVYAPMARILPALRGTRLAEVTVDMLLEHCSGLSFDRRFWEDIADSLENVVLKPQDIVTVRAAYDRAMSEVLLESDPGNQERVSLVGFMVLGWVLEAVTNLPLATFLKREVFQPLELDKDLFFVERADPVQRRFLAKRSFASFGRCAWRDRVIQGEVWDRNAWVLGGVAGHAGLFGTGAAVYRLCRKLWAAHRGQDRFFLGGAVQRFWTRSKRLRDTTRTLGWDTPSATHLVAGKRFSRTSIGHTSRSGSMVWIDLSSNVMGVLLTNADPGAADETSENDWFTFRSRLFELIAKSGEALPADTSQPTGARAFHAGTSPPAFNPLKK